MRLCVVPGLLFGLEMEAAPWRALWVYLGLFAVKIPLGRQAKFPTTSVSNEECQ